MKEQLPNNSLKSASSDHVTIAAQTIQAGGLVAFPTETVYGLGADATNDNAVACIFDVKGRPYFNPLIVHFSNQVSLAATVVFNEQAKKLITLPIHQYLSKKHVIYIAQKIKNFYEKNKL